MVQRGLFAGFVALALMLPFPAIDALAQSPAADLHVVVLATAANTAQRPFVSVTTKAGSRDEASV